MASNGTRTPEMQVTPEQLEQAIQHLLMVVDLSERPNDTVTPGAWARTNSTALAIVVNEARAPKPGPQSEMQKAIADLDEKAMAEVSANGDE